MCGENVLDLTMTVPMRGSSPRVRGKLRLDRIDLVHVRLIPACAGKTQSLLAQAQSAQAHPRVCGENLKVFVISASFSGSSPRVRGKHAWDEFMATCSRLIPACAGKTRRMLFRGEWKKAHPRVCGENAGTSGRRLRQGGSSPRVRGKHYSCNP